MSTNYISLETLAARIRLSQKYLRELATTGRIPVLDTGSGRLRFKEQSVRDALDKIEMKSVRPSRKRTKEYSNAG